MSNAQGPGWRPTVPAMLHAVAAGGGPRLRAAFAEAGLDDIRPAHAVVLVPLALGPLHASALAEHLTVTRQAVAQAIGPLERNGYVTRSTDETDGRVLLIALTPRGREALRVMRANALDVEEHWRDVLGQERLDGLRDTLAVLLTDLAADRGDHESRRGRGR